MSDRAKHILHLASGGLQNKLSINFEKSSSGESGKYIHLHTFYLLIMIVLLL
jgi:hypothetical protein